MLAIRIRKILSYAFFSLVAFVGAYIGGGNTQFLIERNPTLVATHDFAHADHSRSCLGKNCNETSSGRDGGGDGGDSGGCDGDSKGGGNQGCDPM